MSTCHACELHYDGHPAAHPEGCTCDFNGQRRSIVGSIVPITDWKCPKHGQCAWLDCNIPGWHLHPEGSERWIKDGDVRATFEVGKTGVVEISRNALAELLTVAGYVQLEEGSQ